jgi:PAS domain S-box-containing protein
MLGDEKYKLIFDIAPEAIVILDKKGNFVEVNGRVEDWLGYKPKEIVGKHFLSAPFLTAKTKIIVAKKFAMRIAGKHIPPYNLEVKTKDNKTVVGQVTGTQIKDKKGKIIGSMVMISDVTDVSEFETETNILKQAVESSSEIVFLTNQDGIFTYVNPTFTKIYGYLPEEVVGKSRPSILKGGKKTKKEYQYFWEHITSGQTVEWEIVNKTKAGKLIDLRASISPIQNKEKEIIGFLAIQKDITQEKNTVNKLKQSEKKYRSLFENMPVGFALHRIITDPNGAPIDYEFVEVNQAFLDMLGFSGNQVIGNTVTKLIPGIEKDPANWIGKYGQVALSGKNISFEDYSEPLKKWFSVSSYSPEKNYFVVLFYDITECKKSEELAKGQKEQAEKLNQLMIGRELKMAQLKEKMESLEAKLFEKDQPKKVSS